MLSGMKKKLKFNNPLMRDTAPILASTALSQAAVSVIYLLSARALGPAAFGQTMTLIAIMNFITLGADFGQNSYILREISSGRKTVGDFANQVHTKTIFAGGVALLIGGYLAITQSDPLIALTVIFYCLLLSTEVALQAMVRWTAGARHYSRSVLTDKFTSLIVFGALLVLGLKNIYMVPLALSAGSIAGIISAQRSHKFEISYKHADRKLLKRAIANLKLSKGFGFYSFATTMQNLDIAFLRKVSTPVETGYYSAVSTWTKPLVLIAASYTQASYPHLAAAPDNAAARKLLKSGRKILFFAVGYISAIILLAPRLVDLLLGPEYASSVPVLRLMCVAMIPATINAPLSSFLQARLEQRYAAIVVASGIFIQLVAILALGGQFGGEAGGYAWIAGQLFILVLLGWKVMKI